MLRTKKPNSSMDLIIHCQSKVLSKTADLHERHKGENEIPSLMTWEEVEKTPERVNLPTCSTNRSW